MNVYEVSVEFADGVASAVVIANSRQEAAKYVNEEWQKRYAQLSLPVVNESDLSFVGQAEADFVLTDIQFEEG